jgi:hypothetical protein
MCHPILHMQSVITGKPCWNAFGTGGKDKILRIISIVRIVSHLWENMLSTYLHIIQLSGPYLLLKTTVYRVVINTIEEKPA